MQLLIKAAKSGQNKFEFICEMDWFYNHKPLICALTTLGELYVLNLKWIVPW